jgi:hypothetical protein
MHLVIQEKVPVVILLSNGSKTGSSDTFKIRYEQPVHKNMLYRVFFFLDLWRKNTFAQQSALYDESKVPAYTLPELLQTVDGEKVTTQKTWEEKRRPEIIKLFRDHVYGK